MTIFASQICVSILPELVKKLLLSVRGHVRTGLNTVKVNVNMEVGMEVENREVEVMV